MRSLTPLLIILGIGPSLCADQTQVHVHLTDGSRIVGAPLFRSLTLHAEAIGKLEIPVDKLACLTGGGTQEIVTVLLANGDVLRGTLSTADFPVRAGFGEVKLPARLTREIEFRRAAPAELTKGLVAHYPFNGDARDQSGQENHGQIEGAEFVEAGIAKVLQVAGRTTSFVKVPRAASLEPTEELTIALWVKGVPGQAAGHGWGTLLRKAENCQPGYFLRGGGITQFIVTGPQPCNGGPVLSVTFREFSADRWQHIAATYSRPGGFARTYQDGELVTELPAAERLSHTGDLFVGGANVAGDDGGFRGLITDLRIYNRALTAAEIALLVNQGSPRP
jgi:hypothetical protein